MSPGRTPRAPYPIVIHSVNLAIEGPLEIAMGTGPDWPLDKNPYFQPCTYGNKDESQLWNEYMQEGWKVGRKAGRQEGRKAGRQQGSKAGRQDIRQV